jgi:hypothetical protein
MIIVSFSNQEILSLEQKKEVDIFIQFYIDKLLSKQNKSSKKYYIHIEFCSRLEGKKGETEVESDETEKGKYKEYLILIKKSNHSEGFLQTIAHELTHVKQYMEGRLNFGKDMNHTIWNGKTYDERKISYWFHPWEIDAYGTEKCIYELYLEKKSQT